jgi:hypothetical protein
MMLVVSKLVVMKFLYYDHNLTYQNTGLYAFIFLMECTLDEGTEVLFNRDYCPLWSRSLSGTVLEANLTSNLNLNTSKYFYFDRDAPYSKNGSANLRKCLEILSDCGVADRHHKILERFEQAANRGNIGDIMPNRFS